MKTISRSTKGEIEPTSRIQPLVRLENTMNFPKRTRIGIPNHEPNQERNDNGSNA